MTVNINKDLHAPLWGWITAGIMAATYYGSSKVFPKELALIFALAIRVAITRAADESSLCHFIDAFALGGKDRHKIIALMKSPTIGAYGAIGLVLYIMLFYNTIFVMNISTAALTIFMAVPYSKMLSTQLVMMLPHATTEGEPSSARAINIRTGLILALEGLLPLGVYAYFDGFNYVDWEIMLFMPAVVMYGIYYFVWKRLRSYTNECQGAMCLMIELSVYLSVVFEFFIPYR